MLQYLLRRLHHREHVGDGQEGTKDYDSITLGRPFTCDLVRSLRRIVLAHVATHPDLPEDFRQAGGAQAPRAGQAGEQPVVDPVAQQADDAGHILVPQHAEHGQVSGK